MKVFGALAVLKLLLATQAFAAVPPIPENVFRPDDRSPAHKFEGALRWTGKLISPGGGGCTATLVYEDLVLTAAHCVVDEKAGAIQEGDYSFQLGLIRGQAVEESGVSHIWVGTTDPDKKRASDWAILRLKKSLGVKYGWMGVHATDLKDLLDEDVLGVTGYGGGYRLGQTASVESGCRFTSVRSNGTILHDCDTLPGVSGAPIYRAVKDEAGRLQYFIFAINVASPRDKRGSPYIGVAYSNKVANVAVPSSVFVAKLKAIISAQ